MDGGEDDGSGRGGDGGGKNDNDPGDPNGTVGPGVCCAGGEDPVIPGKFFNG